jgi:competence protein ComEC
VYHFGRGAPLWATATKDRARGRATAIGTRAGGGWAGLLVDRVAAGLAAFATLVQAEARAARLAPWLPVAFGFGILLYFAASAEPSLAAGAVSLVLLAAVAWVSRDQAGTMSSSGRIYEFTA